jgi:CheY-like chemotaxis protein
MPALQVLVIEDDNVAARFLCDAIAQAGHAAAHAVDGSSGIGLAAVTRYDWIITDMRLPDMDGETVIARLRTGGASARTPVVAMSGELAPQRRRALVAAGFHAAWEKPLRMAALQSLFLAPRATLRETAKAYVNASSTDVEFDDAAALAACGSADVLSGLRALFAAELPEQLTALRAALNRGDAKAIDAIVHKLRGGCRFCGAMGLQRALDALGASHASTSALARMEEFARRVQTRFQVL